MTKLLGSAARIRSGCINPAFSGAHKWAELLCHPLRCRGSPKEGAKSKVARSPLLSQGPTNKRVCYVTLAFSGVPRRGDKIRGGYITPAFSGAHKWVGFLRQHDILGGPRKRGRNQKWLHHPCLLKGPKVGGTTPATLGGGGGQRRGQNQKWLHPPCPPRGPQVGGSPM